MPQDNDILIPKTVPISSLLSDVEPIEWLIADVLDRGTLAAIVAPPSRFKSFVAIDMACSIATGTDWLGHPTHQGTVVYLCGEGRRGVLDRVRAWFHHKNLDHTEVPLMITQGSFAAQESETMGAYISAVTRSLNGGPQIIQSPSLIIIDTYSRYAAGLDENSASETATMIKQLERLQKYFGATVLVVHHVAKATGDARGSSAFVGALDWQYTIMREGDEGKQSKALDLQDLRCTISLTKSKDHAGIDPLSICGVSITGAHDGEAMIPYSSLVFEINDGLDDDIYHALSPQAQLVLNAYLLCIADNPRVTLSILEEASNKTSLSQILRQINVWLTHRLSVREIAFERPSTQGLAALGALISPFEYLNLPEAQPRKKQAIETLIVDSEL